MGGEIGVISEEGQGSLFHCEIPFELSSSDDGSASIDVGTRLFSNKQIALWCPQATRRLQLSYLLKAWQCAVHEVKSVTELRAKKWYCCVIDGDVFDHIPRDFQDPVVVLVEGQASLRPQLMPGHRHVIKPVRAVPLYRALARLDTDDDAMNVGNVVIVDNWPEQYEIVLALLNHEGFQCTKVGSASEMRDHVRHNPCDLVIALTQDVRFY